MADLADVETALQGLIAGWCYPGGTSQPSAVPGNVVVRVARGWPTKDQLTKDLAAQVANVTIFSQPGSERLTTRYPRSWEQLSPPATTIIATLASNQVTFSGQVSTPQNVAVIVNGTPYLHAVQPNDTLGTVAYALASLISADTPASSNGPVLTIGAAYRIVARVGGAGTSIRELRRQERMFQITLWCATPLQRDVLSNFIDSRFAGYGLPYGLEFINLSDGSQGRVLYVRTAPTDKDELVGSYRRDFIYSVEFPTTESMNAPAVVVFGIDLRNLADPPPPLQLPLTPGSAGRLDGSDLNQSALMIGH